MPMVLGKDACSNHNCSKYNKCKWYIHNSDAYKVVNVFVNCESKCKMFEDRKK